MWSPSTLQESAAPKKTWEFPERSRLRCESLTARLNAPSQESAWARELLSLIQAASAFLSTGALQVLGGG